jgi:hypothetical protein
MKINLEWNGQIWILTKDDREGPVMGSRQGVLDYLEFLMEEKENDNL